MPTGHARFFVRERAGELGVVHPVFREYSDGVVSAGVPLVADLPDDTSVWIGGIDPAGNHFAYCVRGGTDEQCFARELAAFPDGEPQSFGVEPVPAGASMSTPAWIAEWGAYYFTVSGPMPEPNGVYRAAFTDGALGTPEVLVAPIGEAVPSDTTLAPDRTWVSFTARPEPDGPEEVFVIPADGADPTAWNGISDVTDPEFDVGIAAHLNGSQALVYSIDDTVAGIDGDAALYLVDLSELPVVGSPVRVDAPSVDGLRVRGPRVAPDDHALVYWVGAGDSSLGELMLVTLDELVPQLPVRISTAAQDEAFRGDFDWSPDARWVVYTAAPDFEADWNLYLVDLAEALPAAPEAATGPAVEKPSIIGFDSASRWCYFVADIGDGSSIFRVDVSGAQPIAPQVVAAPPSPGDALTGEAIWTHSGMEMMFTVDSESLEMRQLWIVEVSGERPGAAMRLDTLRTGGGVEYGARPSLDDGLVAVKEQRVEFGGPEPMWLVDRSAPGEAVRIGDDAETVVFLPD